MTACSIVMSRSASASTTNGSEPPSSSTLFFSALPAAAATKAPARSLPVSVTAATRGSAIERADTSGTLPAATIRLVNRPSGAPAVRNASSSASAVPETFGACLSSAALPASSAGAAKRMTCQSGKFHGITAKTTPIGSYVTIEVPAPASTVCSASMPGPTVAKCSHADAPFSTSKRDSKSGLPTSLVTSCASSRARSRRTLATAVSSSARSVAGLRRHSR